MCDEPGPENGAEDWEDPPAEDPALAPGERLFYALGQLYKLWRRDQLAVHPLDFDVWDLAGIIGVRGEVEFISEDRDGARYHFPGEVLVIEKHPDSDFPWCLLDTWDWAAAQGLTESAAEDED